MRGRGLDTDHAMRQLLHGIGFQARAWRGLVLYLAFQAQPGLRA